MRLSILVIILLAGPAFADPELHEWYQPDDTTQFATEVNGVRGTVQTPVTGVPEVGGPYDGMIRWSVTEEATRPYFWTVVAINADGETYAENGPQQRDPIPILMPPAQPILIGPAQLP